MRSSIWRVTPPSIISRSRECRDKTLRDARPPGTPVLAHCWAHGRRKLHEVFDRDASPIPEEGLRRIAELYRIEAAITHENGGKFARHDAVTDAIGLDASFCDPQSPWRRRSIENARIRRDPPRKTTLANCTDADVDDVIWNLSATPRKCLSYCTPIEAFAATLVSHLKWESSGAYQPEKRGQVATTSRPPSTTL